MKLRSNSSLYFFLFVTSLWKELKFHAKKMYAIDCHWQQRFIDAIKLSLKIKLAKYNVGIGLSLSRQPLYQCTKHACIFWMQRNDDRPRLCCSVLIKKKSVIWCELKGNGEQNWTWKILYEHLLRKCNRNPN